MSAKHAYQAGDLERGAIPGQRNSGQRILVVEGEQDLRQITAEVLIDAGYEVDVAENGAAAWSALQQSKYELLVADQFMPDESGVELLKQIHAARIAVPAIMAIGFLPTWEFALHEWIQPVKFLLKPFTFTELLGVVRNMLHETADVRGATAAPPVSPPAP